MIMQTILFSAVKNNCEMFLVDDATWMLQGRVDMSSFCVKGAARHARQQVRVIERYNDIKVNLVRI